MVVTSVRLGCAGVDPRAGEPRAWSTKVISVVATGNGPAGRVVVVVAGAVVVVLVASSSRRRERSRRSSASSPPGAMRRTRREADVVEVDAAPELFDVEADVEAAPPPSLHAASATVATTAATTAPHPCRGLLVMVRTPAASPPAWQMLARRRVRTADPAAHGGSTA